MQTAGPLALWKYLTTIPRPLAWARQTDGPLGRRGDCKISGFSDTFLASTALATPPLSLVKNQPGLVGGDPALAAVG